MALRKFRLPCANVTETFAESLLRNKVVVISIIGKTAPEIVPEVKNPNVMDDIEELLLSLGAENQQCNEDLTQFDAYYDSMENIIYISLFSPSDNSKDILVNPKIRAKIESEGLLKHWSDAQIAYARALLFCFSVSHMVLFVSSNYSLNVKAIQLFKVLSYVRPRYQNSVMQAIGKLPGIPDDWCSVGRLCSPRLIFLFKGCPSDILQVPNKYDQVSKLKELEHALEDQIYISLRQNRVVKDMCNRALFSIAPNDEFVFLGLHTDITHSSLIYHQYFGNYDAYSSGGSNCSEGSLNSDNGNGDGDNDIRDDGDELSSLSSDTAFASSFHSEDASDETSSSNVNPSSGESTSSDSSRSQNSPPKNQILPASSIVTVTSDVNFPRGSAKSENGSAPGNEKPSGSGSGSACRSGNASASGRASGSVSGHAGGRSHSNEGYKCKLSDPGIDEDFFSNLQRSKVGGSTTDEGISEPQESAETSRHSVKDLVMKHVRKAHTDGFSDNMGKFSNARIYFEVPTLLAWITGVNAILNFPETGLKEPNTTSRSLEKLLGTELKFSNARCKKVLPLAVAAYQENLPSHYSLITHEKQLKRAIAVFSHHARGPAQPTYINQLKAECERIWRNGRQLCEALSLNRNPCTKPKHSSSSSECLDRCESDHWSGIQFYSSCNCGSKQGPRQDPFTLRAANYDFYLIIGQECGCIHLDSINFPVFQPSTLDYREADLANPVQEVQHELHELHLASPSTSTGKVWNVHGSAHGSEATMSIPLSTTYFDQTNNLNMNYRNERHLVRQASTTEYLPGIIHLESPMGLLPEFPSWSLVCRGPSSLYSHNLGLHDCPGFIPGSAYLLPWDVSFREKDMCKIDASEILKKISPGMGVQILKPGFRRHHRQPKEFMSIKIFIGMEYECLRGHRFMSPAPGVVLNATGQSVKEDAHKVTEGNMPIFLPCPCGKVLAQLMRVHIVTPKAPIFVTVDPKVRPAPPPCPTFVTGEPKPIALSQSAYWVLRLPYVYASERKVFNMPSRLKNLRFGELLGPMFGITQADV